MTRLAFAVAVLLSMAARAATVDVDCTATSPDPPLSKSFVGVYQTPFWFTRHPPGSADGRRLVALLREAGVRDLRYELAWGKPDAFAPDQVSTDARGRPILDPAPLAPFLHGLADAHVTPLLSLGYCPVPLQHGPPGWQRWKDVPGDLNAWSAVCHQAATAWSFCRPSFEVWNEPDLPGDGGKAFFAGGPAAYARLYAATAAAVRPVGGPAVAYDTAFLPGPAQPADFVSVHAYGNGPAQLAAVRAALKGRRVPIYLTEYASYAPADLAGSTRGPAAAAAFFADVDRLLAEPGLAKVYWAQWADDSMGMVDDALRRRPLFDAYAAYQTLLPTTRRPVRADGVGAMAAADGPAAAVAVWNATDAAAAVTVSLNHAPATGTLRVFRLDGGGGDHPLAAAERRRYAGDHVDWSGVMPPRTAAVLRADGGR